MNDAEKRDRVSWFGWLADFALSVSVLFFLCSR